jgi:hypothetical protein
MTPVPAAPFDDGYFLNPAQRLMLRITRLEQSARWRLGTTGN